MARKGRRQKLDGAGVDWVGSWRKFYNWGPGVGKYIKKRMNRQERQKAKQEIKQDVTTD